MIKYEQWREASGLTLLRGWVREGISEAEIARRMEVSHGTLRDWKKKYPEIRSALDQRSEVVDYEVEAALLRKALGYESTEYKVEISPKGERKETETTKQVAPDVSAISLWLKKRKPETWGDGGRGEPPPNNLREQLAGAIDLEGIPELQTETEEDADP